MLFRAHVYSPYWQVHTGGAADLQQASLPCTADLLVVTEQRVYIGSGIKCLQVQTSKLWQVLLHMACALLSYVRGMI
jgi:hypothetical protein